MVVACQFLGASSYEPSADYAEITDSLTYLDSWSLSLTAIPNAVRYWVYRRISREPAWVAETSGQWALGRQFLLTAGAGYYRSQGSGSGIQRATGYGYGNAGVAWESGHWRVDLGYFLTQEAAQRSFPYPIAEHTVAGSLSSGYGGNGRKLPVFDEPQAWRHALTPQKAYGTKTTTNQHMTEPTYRGAAAAAHEAQLIARIAEGDRRAFEELYNLYHRRMARFLTRLTRRYDVAEEVINDTFWVVWRKAGDFRGDSQPSTWILGIAYRKARSAFRASARLAERNLDSTDEPLTTEAPANSEELRDWLGQGLAQLPVEQRMAVELCYELGYSCGRSDSWNAPPTP